MSKSQKKLSAKDKALHVAGLDAQAAAAPPGGRKPTASAGGAARKGRENEGRKRPPVL